MRSITWQCQWPATRARSRVNRSRGGAEAFRDLAGSGESWFERDADRERFQRYETSRKQSAKRKEQRASRRVTPLLLF